MDPAFYESPGGTGAQEEAASPRTGSGTYEVDAGAVVNRSDSARSNPSARPASGLPAFDELLATMQVDRSRLKALWDEAADVAAKADERASDAEHEARALRKEADRLWDLSQAYRNATYALTVIV